VDQLDDSRVWNNKTDWRSPKQIIQLSIHTIEKRGRKGVSHTGKNVSSLNLIVGKKLTLGLYRPGVKLCGILMLALLFPNFFEDFFL
jgi:hypothetical protein